MYRVHSCPLKANRNKICPEFLNLFFKPYLRGTGYNSMPIFDPIPDHVSAKIN